MSAARALGSMLAALAAVSAVVLSAGSVSAQVSVGPNQQFAGRINGSAVNATIFVICPGPSRTGHPRAGQAVQVVQNTGSGFTGSAADRIVATFGTSTTTPQTLVFRQYGVSQDIPTRFVLPCSGTGTIPFTPQPTSPTARSATVNVRFVNIGV